jgi:sirohydrochlorin cobaltochelatase
MGIAGDGDGYAMPETVESGNERKRIWYTGAVGTEPGIAEVITELAGDACIHTDGCGTTDRDVSVRKDAESWFVGWLEGGERTDVRPAGRRMSWGQLSLTVRDDGYDVRHEDDLGKHTDELDAYDDPKDARFLAKFDDEGGYRPMRGETTLPTGWVFPSLDADGLVEVVRRIYPTSIENAYLESRGELDVTNWEETAGRQTGMYADVDELTGDALRRTTDAFCASRCVKRREWEESEDKTVDSESEGDFPCREACSLFISGAREFVKQESEQDEDVKMDVPAEDAPRRGNLADPANEYRVRYTSARRKEVKDVR